MENKENEIGGEGVRYSFCHLLSLSIELAHVTVVLRISKHQLPRVDHTYRCHPQPLQHLFSSSSFFPLLLPPALRVLEEDERGGVTEEVGGFGEGGFVSRHCRFFHLLDTSENQFEIGVQTFRLKRGVKRDKRRGDGGKGEREGRYTGVE